MKKILSTLAFAAAGIGVAALVDDDFRDALVKTGKSVKDKIFPEKEVDAEPDEEPEAPTVMEDSVNVEDLEDEPAAVSVEEAQKNVDESIQNMTSTMDEIDNATTPNTDGFNLK